MHLRIGGNRDLEIRHALEASHQIRRVCVAAGMRHIGAVSGHVTAQGHDVTHAGIPVAARHIVHLAAIGAHAGQVRGRRQAGFAHDTRNGGMRAGLR